MLTFSITSASSNDVVILEAGEKAPFTGYLFTKEKAQLTRIRLIEGDEAKSLNESYVRSIVLYKKNEEASDKQVNVLLERNDVLSEQLRKSQRVSQFEKIAWFVGGILVSSAAVYGASKLAR